MKTTRKILLVAAVSVFASFGVFAQMQQRLQAIIQRAPETGTNAAAQNLNCSGTVTDVAGSPLAGATVEYWRFEGNPFLANHLELNKQITTDTNGAFEFQVSRASGNLLARKPGLAPAWQQLGPQAGSAHEPGEKWKLVLATPAALAGVVVDEADKPVANAEVSVAMAVSEIPQGSGARTFNYITGKPAQDCFAARTDPAGRFRIENFPANATAMLAVESPGKALRSSSQDFAGFDSLPWRAGQADIKLVMEPAGSIEGKIIAAGSNQPPPVAELTLQPDTPGFFGFTGHEPVQSGAEGAFRINDVAAGSYRIHAVFGTNAVPEWVADAIPVSVESGQATHGVQVTAAHGGLLEAAVIGKNDRKPLAQVMVNAYRESFQSAARSDSNGIALLRLPPGDYRVMASQEFIPGDQTSASVEAGKTNRVEIEITAPQKITGIVRQPDGQPAAGLLVRIVGSFGGGASEVKTDASGKFELEWNQRRFGQNDSTACILVRDVEHNLAVAQDIDEDTGPLDLKLTPGLTLAGRAECSGQPLTNATAQLVFWTGRSGSWLQGLARTNAPGQYEIPALPPGRRYGVIVSAPGYGQKQFQNLEIFTEAGRQELDPVELKLANLKLGGQVLDADDKPVAGADVNLNGDSQPGGYARTDHEGRFRFEHVCEGPAQLSANSRNSYGNISAEGGDTNVVLRLGQTYNNSPGSTAHKLKGTVVDGDGKPAAGAQVAVFPSNGNGPRWTKTGTNGAFGLTWSLQSWQLQNGGAMLVFRDPARNLAGSEELPEDATNLDVKLKPALAFSGQVKNTDGALLTAAQVGLWLKVGNSYEQLNEQTTSPVNAEGRFEIKCLPPEAQYLVYASAKGYGKGQQQLQPEYESNHVELATFVLKQADRVIAGKVLKDDEKPASGVNINLNGDGQPDGNLTTDSQGRFHFQVCEGQIRLFAYSQNGSGNAQATVEAGDTNIVMTLSSRSGSFPQTPRRASLKGRPLSDLTTVNFASDIAPAGKPVLICLFDAGQRPSRHAIHQLDEQAAALRQQGVTLLGVQAAVVSDGTFNEWKTSSPVSFPVGRVTEKSDKTKWASAVPALPWLILTDADHRVIAEGFLVDELDTQIKKLAK